MTILVYRDGIIAADTMCWWPDEGVLQEGHKLYLDNVGAWAICGDAAQGNELRKSLIEQRPPNFKIDPNDDGEKKYDASLYFVNREVREVKCYDTSMGYDVIEWDETCAMGSGAAIATGALHMGATAVEAVRAACVHSPHCGAPIEYIRLEESYWRIRKLKN